MSKKSHGKGLCQTSDAIQVRKIGLPEKTVAQPSYNIFHEKTMLHNVSSNRRRAYTDLRVKLNY